MNNLILVDTSPLVAIVSPKDNYHQVCVDTLKTISPPLLTTWAVITETLWLVRHNQKAIKAIFTMIQGELIKIDPLSDNAITWLDSFMTKYYDIGVQIADASLCYLAEMYNIDTVFTLDKKDFTIYRIKEKKLLNIIP